MTDKQLIAELKNYIISNNPEKYFFEIIRDIQCVETCNLKDDSTKIGSFNCSQCENCIKINNEENWIVCLKIDQATNKPETK